MKSWLLSMTSPIKFHHENQILLYMWSCDQSLVTLTFLWQKLSYLNFRRIWPEKPIFFEGAPSFKFNNWGLVLVTTLKFYTNKAKWLKVKVKKFWGLIPRKKMVRGVVVPLILNRVMIHLKGPQTTNETLSFFWIRKVLR